MLTRQRVRLGDVCQVAAGPSGALLGGLHDGPDGVPVITPPNVTDDHAIDARRLRRVPGDAAEKLSRFALRPGDVLYVRQGALGRLALIEPQHAAWLYGSAFLRLRPRKDRLLSSYLVAYLSHEPTQKAILSLAIAGTVPSLNTALVSGFSITIPTLEQQHAIVETMSDIDSSIRIHRKIIDRLEALEQAIFGEMTGGRAQIWHH